MSCKRLPLKKVLGATKSNLKISYRASNELVKGNLIKDYPRVKIVICLIASRTIMTRRSTAGLVQQPCSCVTFSSCRRGKQGDSETSEHLLYWESSVRVRRKPLVNNRMATLWSTNINRNIENAHTRPPQFSLLHHLPASINPHHSVYDTEWSTTKLTDWMHETKQYARQ